MYNEELTGEIKNLLLKRSETIAVAESVTAGYLQFCFALAENASLFFQGGITAYNVLQKCNLLNVNVSDAIASNCVSPAVAVQMAEGSCVVFNSSWGIAITGYATEMPPFTNGKLFACYAIAFNGKKIKSGMITTKPIEASKVQQYYAATVLNELLKVIKRRKP